ncbi:MAG: DMT family transporter [Negativicutes bacterium]
MFKNKQLWGYLAVFISAVMFGVGGPVTKYIYNYGVNPLFLLKVRMICTTVILYFGLRIFAPQYLKIRKRDILSFAILGIVGFGGYIACTMVAVSKINVGLAVFLLNLAPAVMVIYLTLWRRERSDGMTIFAVALSLCGGLLMVLSQPLTKTGGIGVVLGIVSAILYAFQTLRSKSLGVKYKPLTIVFYTFASASLFWIFVPIQIDWHAVVSPPLWTYIYVVIFYTVIPRILFIVGLVYIPPANAGVTAAAEPVIAAWLAFLTLGEAMGFLQIIGGAAVLAAIVVLQAHGIRRANKRRRDKDKPIEPLAG